MTGWQTAELTLKIGPLRQADLALAACGLGFGLVIAPLAAAVLDLTRSENHGLASSLVVLARTVGMLIGLSALTAFGLHRFHQILGSPVLNDPTIKERVDHLTRLVAAAFLQEYREIFGIAAILCVLAGVVILVTLGPRRYFLTATASRWEWWYRNASSGSPRLSIASSTSVSSSARYRGPSDLISV